MKRIFPALLLAVLACSPVDARPRHWYTDLKWWAGEAVIVGAVVADGRSTCLGYSRGLVEGNALGRGTHSCASAVSVLAVGGAIYTSTHVWSYRLLQNDESRPWRAARLVTIPAIACAFHCTAAARNYGLLPPR